MTNASPTTSLTSEDSSRDVVLRAYELINAGMSEQAAEVIHPEYVNHEREDRPGGVAGFQDGMKRLRSSFSDFRLEALDVIAEGDRVAARTRFTATHDGQFKGIPPSGKAVSIQQIHVFRLQDGLIAEHWVCRDDIGLMRQIGAIGGASL